ncbi:MAG: S26 family signal peptidase [Firmicutes bacterium]|nr:S26 family signal peptidase [Bacillota bacterium]
MGKFFRRGLSATVGICLGLLLYSAVMVVEVKGSTMLPEMEPGDRLLVSRLTDGEHAQVGDVIVYEAPYYTIDGEGRTLIRRVIGSRGGWLKVDCDTQTTKNQETLVAKEQVQGKVILNFSRINVTF